MGPVNEPRAESVTPTAGPGVGAAPAAWPTGRLLSAAARQVERAWDAYLERWSLTHATLPVLAVLAGGPHSQREIAQALKVTEQTTSRMLGGLERTGYVRRERHATDRRRHVVALTETGRTTLGALDDPATVERLVAASLSAEQVGELRALLLHMLEGGPPTA
ncbi:winged helix-turn-helix transcriptional regulator [Georgenia yuyongxinii]|uniref:Winged helix-turn-helix transcriptional regulator n=1 Tax=Georgenia yuyongxinii TaxID=2589797 RepID=A0A5B8C9T3_9MICO|nr:winged helix-turn-helix transcriptional regulator [Georgenia yuyongxinii]